MEVRATYREAKVSKVFGWAVLVFFALWLGIFSGYLVSGLGGSKAVAPSHVAPAAVIDQSQGGPQSDLTRALPGVKQDDPNFIQLEPTTSKRAVE